MSDSLEIGGGVDVDGTFLEFYLGDIGGTGFDERFRPGVVWEREQRFETSAIEERRNAESVRVAAGDGWFAGILLLRDERSDDICIDERLIAGEQNDGVEFRPRAEQMTQAAANGGAEAPLPFQVLDDARGRFTQFGFNAVVSVSDYDANARAPGFDRGADSAPHQALPLK